MIAFLLNLITVNWVQSSGDHLCLTELGPCQLLPSLDKGWSAVFWESPAPGLPLALLSFPCLWHMFICVSLTCGSCCTCTCLRPLILKGKERRPPPMRRVTPCPWAERGSVCNEDPLRQLMHLVGSISMRKRGVTYTWRGGTGEGS